MSAENDFRLCLLYFYIMILEAVLSVYWCLEEEMEYDFIGSGSLPFNLFSAVIFSVITVSLYAMKKLFSATNRCFDALDTNLVSWCQSSLCAYFLDVRRANVVKTFKTCKHP